MATHKSTAVGAFVLGGLALGAAAIVLFGGASLFASNLRAVVYFHDSVAGLAVGAPVTLRGVKVGTVRAMTVRLKLPGLVPVIPVTLEIDPHQISLTNGGSRAGGTDLDAAITAGLRAQLTTQSLVTGQLAVNLDFHPEVPARLSGDSDGLPEIPSIPSDFQKIKDDIADLKLPELADKARIALVAIDKLAAELSGKIGPAVGSIQQSADAARVTLETATDAMKQLRSDASRTLGDFDRLALSAAGQIESTGKQADQFLAAAGRTIARADKTIAALNDMTAPHAPLRGDIEAAVRDMAASAASLRNLSHDLERNPGGILFGRPSK